MNRALLVGINNYPAPNQLNGCINDISDMANFLTQHCDFASGDIRLLADERATKAAIVDHLTWLCSGIRAGDRILFHYSGHGAQLPTRGATGDVDSVDDTICPVDFDFTPATSITDVDFSNLFTNVPAGVEFIWVSDSCYSGGLLAAKAMLSSGRKINRFAMPVDISWRLKTAQEKNITSLGMSKSISNTPVALISGCTAEQESEDSSFGGRPNGALTYSLLQELQTQPNGLTEPLTTVVININTYLSTNSYAQTPQLEGNAAIQARGFLATV
jgi:metacaspase-1